MTDSEMSDALIEVSSNPYGKGLGVSIGQEPLSGHNDERTQQSRCKRIHSCLNHDSCTRRLNTCNSMSATKTLELLIILYTISIIK